jgi:hypothetical protein
MTETSERKASGSTIGTVLAVLVAIPFVFLLYEWPWLDAWTTFPDVPEKERTGSFKAALERPGVPARLERGGMIILRSADVAEVGASKCDRATTCSRYARRGCREVIVTFTCTYPVKDRSGRAATAILEIASNPDYELGVNAPDWRRPFSVQHNLDLNAAEEKLCRLGMCRGNAAGMR